MDVVRHDSVGMQLVAAKIGAMQDGIFGVSGELRRRQPARTALGRVQCGIQLQKLLSWKIFRLWGSGGTAIPGCAVFLQQGSRQGTEAAPGAKDGFAFRIPVRRVTTLASRVG